MDGGRKVRARRRCKEKKSEGGRGISPLREGREEEARERTRKQDTVGESECEWKRGGEGAG